MKISISWLKEFVDFKENAKEISAILTDLGIETKAFDEDILEVEITANRGDCLSVLGLAREISAKLDLSLKLPKISFEESIIKEKIDLEIKPEVKKFVPYFAYRVISGIKIGPSSSKIKEKLKSYGFRSLNNVVDITNLVMVELGQPMHAFDYEKLGGKLSLRLSKKGESIFTLDGKERKLKAKSLIAQNKNNKIIDLVGIMGGLHSEIDNSTQTIVLQSAVFDPPTIRKTAKYLHHTTDASYRYERGVDQGMAKTALDRAADLIQKECGQAGEAKEIVNSEIEKRKIGFDSQKINALLGTDFSLDSIINSLEKLNFKISKKENDLSAIVPSYRLYDIFYWQDLAEEVLRLNGYSNLQSINLDKKEKAYNINFAFKENLKDKLVALGFSETLSSSFVSKADVQLFHLDFNNLIKIKKPLSLENEFFRPNLVINLCYQAAKNPWFSEVLLFEIGHVADSESEKQKLIVLALGKDNSKKLEEAKKTINEFLDASIEIKAIETKILEKFKIKKSISYLEIELPEKKQGDYYFTDLNFTKVKMPSSFPPAQIDLAFVADSNLSAKEIERFLASDDDVILCELFDEFASNKFGKNKKNIAYHLWIEDQKKSLSESEIAKIRESLIEKVNSRFATTLR